MGAEVFEVDAEINVPNLYNFVDIPMLQVVANQIEADANSNRRKSQLLGMVDFIGLILYVHDV